MSEIGSKRSGESGSAANLPRVLRKSTAFALTAGGQLRRRDTAVAVAVGGPAILLHPPLPLVVVSIGKERGRQQKMTVSPTARWQRRRVIGGSSLQTIGDEAEGDATSDEEEGEDGEGEVADEEEQEPNCSQIF